MSLACIHADLQFLFIFYSYINKNHEKSKNK